jgi:hypothetical protein
VQFARNICCTQDEDLTVREKKEVCDDLGCIYEKCGWKKDGWEDDSYSKDNYDDEDSRPAWNNDGYNKDYDEKYKYQNDYDNDNYQKNKYNNYGNGNYQKNKYNFKYDYGNGNYQKNKYDFKKDYDDDDECTADEREECCTANEKKQWQVCHTLGCNINKVSTMLQIDACHLSILCNFFMMQLILLFVFFPV